MHQCPIEHCKAQIADHLLMCRSHWAQVPPPLQQAVNHSRRAQERSIEALGGYLRARKAAIQFVNQGGDRNG